MSSSVLLWLIVGVITLAADIITSLFLFVWFTVGAITAIIASMLGYNFMVQVIVFVAVSIIFAAVGFPLLRNTIRRTVAKTPTTEQGYIGREFIIDEDVIDKATVKIDGIYWTVRNEGEPVRQGDKVVISGIEGNKLVIKKI